MSIESIITLAESYARQEGHEKGWQEGRQEGRDEGREEAAKLLIEDAVQNQRDLDSLLTSLKAIFKDQAHIDELLDKYYYR
ncbi:hypothetical protein [Ligilactobacillus agilis]|uniref:hypothetical protein n=1 Tax=Ligilactobacillus agilis TaxID=1601 RepID=UPI00242D8C6B|nr:hypothetical protein [Ligilactobacillus agilis]